MLSKGKGSSSFPFCIFTGGPLATLRVSEAKDAIQKVDTRTALFEVRDRLRQVSANAASLREALMGEGESEGEASEIENSLDAQVFELFPIISAIEYSLTKSMIRIGVLPNGEAPQKPAQTTCTRGGR